MKASRTRCATRRTASPGTTPALPAQALERNDAWRQEVIAAERVERQQVAREQRPVRPRAPVSVAGDHVVAQLTIARDLLTHDEVGPAQTAVMVAVMGVEHSGDRAELDAWAADFAPFDEDYEHPAYETTKQAEVLLAELDAIAERHGIAVDPASSTGDLRPAQLPADLLLERRMNRLQVGEHITLTNGARVGGEEFGYAVDGQPVSGDPPVAVRAALQRDAGRAGAPNVSGPDVGADIRAARDVAALCQPVPARRAAASVPSPTARTAAHGPVDLGRGGGRGAGR